MEDSNFRDRIAKLQDALLEGKVDRETYEQLKADLQGTASNTEASRPPQPRPTTRKPAARNRSYPAIQDSNETSAAIALPMREWLPTAASRTIRDRGVWQLGWQLAVFSGVVFGFRVFSQTRPAAASAVMWGVVAAIVGIAAAVLWKLVANVCSDGDRHTGDTRCVFALQFLLVVILYAAGIYWIGLGYYFGEVVGTFVGGRFGHITPGGSALVGGLIGAAKAGFDFVNREV